MSIRQPQRLRRATHEEEERGQRDPLLTRGATEMGLLQSIRQYPPAVFFVLGNEFCERFSFYGMKALLVLYLVIEHHFRESTATFFYHFFTCIAYLTPLFGSVIADSYLGRFKLIFYVSIVYVMGHVLLSFGAVPILSYGVRSFFDMSGLLVIAIATGGIKPCVSAFAADQFGEHQADLRAQFFSFFYFAINAGSLLAFTFTPIIRHNVSCFGSEYCFPLAFGVPGVLMLLALILFLLGWRFYKRYPPSGENMAGMVVRCIGTAAAKKYSGKTEKKKENQHWLDLAAPNFTKSEIAAVKSFLSVALIFGPLVFFWALFDQMGSTWVLQARRLNGRLGYVTILPEQIAVVNPSIILIAIPLFEGVVYPAVRRVVKVTPLRKMAVGGLLTALSFVMAGILQFHVNSTMEMPPAAGRVYVQRCGNASEVFDFSGPKGLISDGKISFGRTEIDAGMYSLKSGNETFDLNMTVPNLGYVVGISQGHGKPIMSMFEYTTEKTSSGATRLYMMVPDDSFIGADLYIVDYKKTVLTWAPIVSGEYIDIRPPFISQPDYNITFGHNCTGLDCPNKINFYAEMGSVHVVNINADPKPKDIHKLVRGNEVSMLWMVPQCIVITIGEVLLSVTGLEFAYSQSAPTMKSMLQALWQLTVFAGNLIDMAVSGSHIIENPAHEFFVYAALMLAVMLIFILLAIRYRYVENEHAVAALEDEKEKNAKKNPDIMLKEGVINSVDENNGKC